MKIFAYWQTKTIVADLKYLRDISFYLLTKKETCGRPLLRYVKRGRLAFPFLKKSLLTKRGVGIEEVSTALAESGSTYNIDILADWIMPKA